MSTSSKDPMGKEEKDDFVPPTDEQLQDFEENANQVFEAFLESMRGDPKFTRDYDSDNDPSDLEDCQYVYTDKAMNLIERMLGRLGGLAEKKFGAYAIDIDISSHLYMEV